MNENISTLIVGLVLLAITALITFRLVRNYKYGGCSSGCSSCSKKNCNTNIKDYFAEYKKRKKLI